MRAIFTVGVLDCFMDHDIWFPYTIGVSAGASNGISYASRQRGRSRFSNIDLLEKYDYIGFRHFLRGRGYIDMKYLFYIYPEKYYPLDYETYFKSPNRFVMVTSNCLTGKAEYFEEKQDADQFIRVIAPEYIAVYLINFAQDSFRKILIPDFFRDMLDKCNGSFRRAILEYIRLYIAPEDQEEFESLTCAQVVRERLAREGTIDEHYKRSDGMPIHLRIMACDGLNKEESIWIFAKDAEET